MGAAVLRSAARTYGAKGLVRRGYYEAQRRSGVLRLPIRGADQLKDFDWLPRIDLMPLRRWSDSTGRADQLVGSAIAAAQSVLDGRALLYGSLDIEVGWPPNWHRDPVTGFERDPLAHWTSLSDNSPGSGDIKDVWEVSRLGAIFDLARAFAHTDDLCWAKAFWTLVIDWWDQNPTNLGPNWMSGQEVALRGIAIMFGLSVFWAAAPPTTRNKARVGSLLRTSAIRVQRTIGYALSQRNNHAISESAFLWSLGTLCPGQLAPRQLDRAHRHLEAVIADQFLPDGSYAQHSFNYQRLAMQTLLWVRWAARTAQVPEPCGLEAALARSMELIGAVIDNASGRVPNLGSNDGALLFRLSGTSIQDFRPLLAHTAAALDLPAPLPGGLADEEAVWFGYPPQSRISRPTRVCPPFGAYHVLAGDRSRALFRAGRLTHRPSHDDQLNFDLWMNGVNVTRDPGTFRYSATWPWRNSLAGCKVHNVARPTLDRDTSQRIGRFFWVNWHEGSVISAVRGPEADALIADLVGLELDGTARRLVVRIRDNFVVVDRVAPGPGWVRWNLPSDSAVEIQDSRALIAHTAFRACMAGGSAPRCLVADESEPTSGWESPLYGMRRPTTSLVVSVDQSGLAWASFALPNAKVILPDASWSTVIEAADHAALKDLVRSLI